MRYKLGPILFERFTPKERACISAKLEEIAANGLRGKRIDLDSPKGRRQAVAVAIRSCAPEKTTQAAAFSAKSIPQISHAYTAERQTNGAYCVRSLPIFSATIDTRRGKHIDFDAAWLRAAVAKHKERAAGGYLPPVHVEHHRGGTNEQAGFLANLRLGVHPVDGETVPTIYADIIEIPAEVFKRIRRMRLPFRSVEILDASKAEISSLALMGSEVPFFRYPLTRVDLASTGDGCEPSGVALMAERQDIGARGRVALFAYRSTNDEVLTMADDRADLFEELEEEAESVEITDDDGDGNGDVMTKLDEILELLRGLLAGGAETEAEPVAEPDGGEMSADFAANAGRMFAANQTLSKRLEALETERAIDARISSWEAAGLVFDPDAIRTQAATFAASGCLAPWLDSVQQNLDAAPPVADFETDAGADLRETLTEDPVLGEFAAADLPPYVFDRAREHYEYWQSTADVQSACNGDPREYVRSMLSSDLRIWCSEEPEKRAEITNARQRLATIAGRNF